MRGIRGKAFFVVTTSLLVAGCAAPLPFQVATWALDGLTLMTTGKSVADHGISLIAQKDCALWRGVTEGQICQDYPEDGVAVARAPSNVFAMTQPVNISWNEPRATDSQVTQLASIAPTSDFAAGSGSVVMAMPQAKPKIKPKAKVTRISKLRAAAERVLSETRRPVAKPAPRYVRPAPLKTSKPVRTADARIKGKKGKLFYVIGSFSYKTFADRLAERHAKLDASIVTAKKNGRTSYRVVIGPFARYEKKKLRRKIFRAGIYDAWATRIDPGQWRMATRPGMTQREVAQSGPVLRY